MKLNQPNQNFIYQTKLYLSNKTKTLSILFYQISLPFTTTLKYMEIWKKKIDWFGLLGIIAYQPLKVI